MVGKVQDELQAIYRVSCEERVEAFLVDGSAAARLGGTGRSSEELLVAEGDGVLELALYLDPALLERLRPFQETAPSQLFDAHLDSYCQLAEGVSHFLYVALAAQSGRTVSLLEIETQGEIDKFAICLLARWGEGETRWAEELLVRLFDRVHYRALLTPAERWRYEEANRLSRNYCSSLLPLISRRNIDRLLSALRYAYRLGAEAKLRHLAEA